jgi:hypothetical protein
MSLLSMAKTTGNPRKPPAQEELPQNAEAEKCLLGFVLVGGGWPENIGVGDFAQERHQVIWRALETIHAAGDTISCHRLAVELGEKKLRGVGLGYLNDLPDGCDARMQITPYIGKLHDAAGRRDVLHHANKLWAHAISGDRTFAELISLGAAAFGGMNGRSITGDGIFEETPNAWRYEAMIAYLVDELIVEEAVTMWTGEAGDGKSTVALALAAAVAQGHPFLGRATTQRQVVYLDRENPIAIVKDRLLHLGIPDISDRLKIWGTWWEGHYPPGPDADALTAYARRHKPLIIFDSLIAFGNCDENSAGEMRHHMQLYRRLAALGATVLIIHHRSDKGQSDYRGSSDIRAVVDAAWRLSRDDGSGAGDALGRLILKPYKTRTGPGKPVRIEYKDGAFLPVDGPVRPALDIALELVTCYPGSTQSDLIIRAKPQGLGERKLVDTLNEAVVARKVDVRRGNHNALRYYPPPEEALRASR